MRVESREVEYAGEQEDYDANLGEPALTARFAHILWCGYTQGSFKYFSSMVVRLAASRYAALRLPAQFSAAAFRYCRCMCNGHRALGGFPNMIHGRVS